MATGRTVLRVVALLAACVVFQASSAWAQSDLGVILLYGKKGTPSQGMNVILSNLQSAGAKAVMPAMPWGGGRWDTINATVEDVCVLIDGQAAQLRSQGARRIVLIGQSLGSAVALGCASSRGNLAGVVVTAPAHSLSGRRQREGDFERAHALVAQGRGNDMVTGSDGNQGQMIRMSVRAAVYDSWMDPRGLASMQAQAKRLPASTPILVVAGEKDPLFPRIEGEIYQPAARNPYSKYLPNGANHEDTPLAGAKAITEWVLGLPR